MPVLTPAAYPQEARQAPRRRQYSAEAVADEAGVGGVVDVGGDDEEFDD